MSYSIESRYSFNESTFDQFEHKIERFSTLEATEKSEVFKAVAWITAGVWKRTSGGSIREHFKKILEVSDQESFFSNIFLVQTDHAGREKVYPSAQREYVGQIQFLDQDPPAAFPVTVLSSQSTDASSSASRDLSAAEISQSIGSLFDGSLPRRLVSENRMKILTALLERCPQDQDDLKIKILNDALLSAQKALKSKAQSGRLGDFRRDCRGLADTHGVDKAKLQLGNDRRKKRSAPQDSENPGEAARIVPSDLKQWLIDQLEENQSNPQLQLDLLREVLDLPNSYYINHRKTLNIRKKESGIRTQRSEIRKLCVEKAKEYKLDVFALQLPIRTRENLVRALGKEGVSKLSAFSLEVQQRMDDALNSPIPEAKSSIEGMFNEHPSEALQVKILNELLLRSDLVAGPKPRMWELRNHCLELARRVALPPEDLYYESPRRVLPSSSQNEDISSASSDQPIFFGNSIETGPQVESLPQSEEYNHDFPQPFSRLIPLSPADQIDELISRFSSQPHKGIELEFFLHALLQKCDQDRKPKALKAVFDFCKTGSRPEKSKLRGTCLAVAEEHKLDPNSPEMREIRGAKSKHYQTVSFKRRTRLRQEIGQPGMTKEAQVEIFRKEIKSKQENNDWSIPQDCAAVAFYAGLDPRELPFSTRYQNKLKKTLVTDGSTGGIIINLEAILTREMEDIA